MSNGIEKAAEEISRESGHLVRGGLPPEAVKRIILSHAPDKHKGE